MDNFAIPPIPQPPTLPGQMPAGLPPKHKVKAEPAKVETSQIEANADVNIEALSDDEFDALIAEEMPPVPQLPPQCDWHLSSMFTANYPDPFSLPALHVAQHSLMHDMAALLHAVVKPGEEKAAADNDSKDTDTK